MTPCEKLGYKVWDKFEVIREGNSADWPVGTIVVLHNDDGSTHPAFRKDNETWGYDFDSIDNVRPLKTSTTLKSGDEITQDGKKYRVTLEEIPQYDFKPGMMCRVAWDGTECCSGHTDSDRVVYISHSPHNGRERIAYVAKNGEITLGYVKTTNLRPE